MEDLRFERVGGRRTLEVDVRLDDVSRADLNRYLDAAAITRGLFGATTTANILVMGPGGYRFVDYLKVGVPLTIWVGFLAGAVGLGVGTLLGFMSGYLGGRFDTVVRGTVDTLLTVPSLVVLISIFGPISGAHFNNDQVVNLSDITLMAQSIGAECP